jgi:hypothetical protein
MPTKITVITRNINNVPDDFPATFCVGEPIMEGGHVVKNILLHRDGYNKKIFRPVYSVSFEDTDEVRLIPEDEITDMAVVKTPAKAAEPVVELPE